MNSCPAVPTPWVRKSTAQGRRRASIRLKAQATEQPAVAVPGSTKQRGTKRTRSPTKTTAKRMRLQQKEAGKENSLMGEGGQHDQSIDGARHEDDVHGAIDPVEPEMQVTSSYSSSSDGRSSAASGRLREVEEMEREGSEGYLEEEDIVEEEEEEMVVDKTDIITSDEGEDEAEAEARIDGPTDSYERMARFRKLSRDLGQKFELMPMREPLQLTNRCHGVGPASEVWSLLCHKDNLHSICNENFMEPHNYPRPGRASRCHMQSDARATLMDWMQDVCSAEKLHRETYHLAVDYVDRVMARAPECRMVIPINKYQLLGTAAIFIAAKYEEIYPPKVDDIVSYTAGACTVEQVRKMELIVLKVLEWELNVITPLHWVHMFLELLTGNPRQSAAAHSSFSLLPQQQDGFYQEGPIELPATCGSSSRDDFLHMAYVMDAVILHEGCRKWTNRTLAAAVLYTVYEADDAIQQVSGLSYTDAGMREVIEWLQPIVQFCEMHKNPECRWPNHDGVRPSEMHTIQCHREVVMVSKMKRLDVVMRGIDELRYEMNMDKERRQRSAAIRIPQ